MTARRMVRAVALIGAGWMAASTAVTFIWAAIGAERYRRQTGPTTYRCHACEWKVTSTDPDRVVRLLNQHTTEQHAAPTRGTPK